LGHTWDSKAGNWKMSDSIYSNPNGSIEISWYKVWDPFISRFYRGKRFKNEYSENGNLVKEDVLKFDTLTGGWKNDMVNFYEYNAGDLQIEKKIRKWDGQSWQDSLKIDFAYNDNKLLELEEYQLMSGSGIWENWQKWDYAYNTTNQLREKYYSLWFSDDKSWKDTRYYIYTYDPDQRLDQILEKYWDDFENDWVDKYVTSYAYNAMGLRSEIKRQYWDPINGYWFHTSNIFYTYDDNRNLIEYLYRYWDEENGQWLNIYKDASYWSYFETQGIGKTEPSVVAVYPNPADDIIQLIFSKPIKQGQCSIYTTGGQFIQSIEVDNSTQFLDISRLPAGNYILGFWADGACFSHKVVIR
nr:T9SS type A sorting domain-containing protein [Bacteroidota bacterium]